MTDMTGQVVVITGASRGIGAAAAHVFVDAGAKVALLARSAGPLKDLVAELGEAAIAIPCDITNYAEVEGAIAKTVETFGRVDVLIGNAGIIEPIAHMAEMDPDGWSQVIDVNLKGVMWGMRAVLPVMLNQGGGTVITVSSGAAHGPTEGWSHYNASKAGAAMLTRSLDHEYGAKGIRSMGLSPGTVATQMQREIQATGINHIARLDWSVHIPADWPARALLWMCGTAGDDLYGKEVSLRDEDVRRAVGLIP